MHTFCRILANLTLPVESLIESTGYSMAEASQTGMSWQQGVESSLHHYRTVFTDKSVLLSLLEEIHTLVEEVKSTINTKMFGFDNKIHQNGHPETNLSLAQMIKISFKHFCLSDDIPYTTTYNS